MARDTRAAVLRELERLYPQFVAAFTQAIQDTRSAAQLQIIEQALRDQDIATVVRVLQIPEQYFAALDQVTADAFNQGGAYALSRLPKKPYPGSSRVLVVRFEGRNQRAEGWIRNKSSNLIREINTDQRVAVRKAIDAGIAEGRNPRQTALDLVGRVQGGKRVGGIVGLTSRQTDWVISRRAKLLNEGRPIAQVDRMVERYKNKLLKMRGDTIARTESLAAFNAGRYEAMQQLLDRGEVRSETDITLQWSATMDGRTRDIHQEMNGVVVPFGQPFISPRTGAALRFPGDTSLGAQGEDVINCRCYVQIRVNWLAQAA